MNRGEYAAVHTAIVDDPAFQALSPNARLMWYTLRLVLGASGIDVVRGTVAVLNELTGLDEGEINGALHELQDGEWLRVQHNVLWLRNVLKFNPSLNLSNTKHQAGLIKHLAGLPKLAIINAFADYYGLEQPFPGMGIEWVSNGYGIQVTRSHGHTDIGHTVAGHTDTVAESSLRSGSATPECEISTIEETDTNPDSGANGTPATWMHAAWEEQFGLDGHPLKMNPDRKQKYLAMYTEQLRDTPDPEAAWRAVLHTVSLSDHHTSKRAYLMPESLLLNANRRERWVQETIETLTKGPATADRRIQREAEELAYHLENRYAD